MAPSSIHPLRANGPLFVFFSALLATVLLFWARHELVLTRLEQPRIHVRWRDAVTPAVRARLEARYELFDPELDEGRTWSYRLDNADTPPLRELVLDPAVEDTQNIDRQRFVLTEQASPGRLDGPLWFLWATGLGSLVGLVASMIGQHHRWRPESTPNALWSAVTAAVSDGAKRAASLLTRGIPDIRPEVLGFFRIFYATFLFVAVARERLDLEPGRVPDDGQLGWEWLGWLASRPDLVLVLEYACLGLLVLFAIGLWTRFVYPLAAAGITTWVLVWIESQHSNAHTWVVTMFMILCLVPVPWGAALSADAAIRRRRREPQVAAPRGKLYGYAIWMPGLIIGTVWASAAYAKLNISGPRWILGGAVRYHWLVDASQATVNWGQWIAAHQWAAVLMSGCGVLFEAVFVLSVFLKPGLWRHLLASTGFALLAGFFLFHGLLWWTWWLVFLSFIVPWNWLFDAVASRFPNVLRADVQQDRTPATPVTADLRPVHVLLIVVVCLHAMFRIPAGFGRFESYSGTFSSTDEFDRVNPLPPIDRVWAAYGLPWATEVDADAAIDAIVRLSQGEQLSPNAMRELRALDLTGQSAGQVDTPRALTLTRQRQSFDWANGRFNPPGPPVVIGTLDLDSLTLVAQPSDAVRAQAN